MKKPFSFNLLILILFLLTCHYVQAQKKPASIGVNMDKVELLYKNYEVIQTSSSPSYGLRSRRYMTEFPFLRINGGELLEIDSRGEVLAPYFIKCQGAQKEISLYKKHSSRAKTFMHAGIGAGVFILFGSVLVTGKSGGESSTPFYTGLGLGFGTIVTGFILARTHAQKAKKHLESGVMFYNNSCYKPFEIGAPDSDAITTNKRDSVCKAHTVSTRGGTSRK